MAPLGVISWRAETTWRLRSLLVKLLFTCDGSAPNIVVRSPQEARHAPRVSIEGVWVTGKVSRRQRVPTRIRSATQGVWNPTAHLALPVFRFVPVAGSHRW